ncbi:hypothetical protein E0493_19710 [Roseomonas sp. M0104]|uniref:Uncharacterized protein n=1 Tax=Teichococcus coralli TaxID=2545983 RepID=A0A845BQ95_9PROT|nr:hypothetical protein [Pseudoroseomonas coralli]MXP65579.1 hypothetical protein [Pseudoroseomonas coralli]
MPRVTPPFVPTHGLRAAVATLLLATTGSAWAQGPEVPHQLPPVASIPLRPDSFDVRAFDPLGMPAVRSPAIASATPKAGEAPRKTEQESHQEAILAALPGAGPVGATPGQAAGMFSNGWTRDGFGSLR